MVDDQTKDSAAETAPRERYYHPARIADCLFGWDALQSDAERVGALRIRNTPAGTSHLFADPMRWAIVQADLLDAWNSLGPQTPAFRMIYLVIFGRWNLCRLDFARDRDWRAYVVRNAGRLLGMSPAQASMAFWISVRLMARHLGWLPADE